jgi:carboxymethylenebutenolidase
MSGFKKLGDTSVTRRGFLYQASLFSGYCILSCETDAEQDNRAAPDKMDKALDDKNIIQEKVVFKSGKEDLDAYMSRPKKKGRFPIVIVISGNSIYEEYIRNMTAMLAQVGFVGIAPNIYSLQKDWMTPEQKRKVLAEQITDEKIFKDIGSSISYLKGYGFANTKRVGITGFCFGGRCALMFAAAYPRKIGAVVPFYGNLKTPAFANRKHDPLDVVKNIRVPVQGHYAEMDPEIPLDQLKTFETLLKENVKEVEIFTYTASHGFFAYTRPTYDLNAAKLSWQRMTAFLRNNLGK